MLFCESTKPNWLRLLVGSMLLLVSTGCTTKEQHRQTADGQLIPGKGPLQFAEYEYVCELTLGKNHSEIEQLLDRYGQSGWRLGGFLHKEGETYAFCLMR